MSTAYNLFSALLLIPYRLPFCFLVQLFILVSSYQQFLLQGDPHVIGLATKDSFLSLVGRFSAKITYCLYNNLKLYWNNMLLDLNDNLTLLRFKD
jgi:hypothetical protein